MGGSKSSNEMRQAPLSLSLHSTHQRPPAKLQASTHETHTAVHGSRRERVPFMAAQKTFAGSRAQLATFRDHSTVDEWYSPASPPALHRSTALAFHTHHLAAPRSTALGQKGAFPRYAPSFPAGR